jgi:Mg2+ and Co2+ transporter CorA
MCEYINTRLGQIEWEIELGLSNLYAQDFDHTLKTLLIWRRRMPIYNAFVERSISRISARYTSVSDTKPFNSWQDILTNLLDILKRLEILHCRADKIMAVSMAVTAREESKKATQESRAITRVSYLAFVFVPLSFWTSFFSMSGEFPLTTYWIYAAVALPISACAFCALVFAGNISRMWRRVRGRGETDLGIGKGKSSKWNSGV